MKTTISQEEAPAQKANNGTESRGRYEKGRPNTREHRECAMWRSSAPSKSPTTSQETPAPTGVY